MKNLLVNGLKIGAVRFTLDELATLYAGLETDIDPEVWGVLNRGAADMVESFAYYVAEKRRVARESGTRAWFWCDPDLLISKLASLTLDELSTLRDRLLELYAE